MLLLWVGVWNAPSSGASTLVLAGWPGYLEAPPRQVFGILVARGIDAGRYPVGRIDEAFDALGSAPRVTYTASSAVLGLVLVAAGLAVLAIRTSTRRLQIRARRLQAALNEQRNSKALAEEQLQLLRRALEGLADRPELDTFVHVVLDDLRALLRASSVYLWRPRPAEFPGVLRRDRSIPTEATWPTLPAKALSARELYVSDGILWLPLWFDNELQGVLAALSDEPWPGEPERFVAQALSAQATLAIRLSELATESRENAVLRERNHLSREIHDSLAQGFVMTGLQLEHIASQLSHGGSRQALKATLERAMALNRMGLAEARRCIHLLRAEPPSEGALLDLLSGLEGLVRLFDLGFEIRPLGIPRDPDPRVSFELYRIAHEAVTNAIRHARGTRVDVGLVYLNDRIVISISDDGMGFGVRLEEIAGIGLTSMDERAKLVGARISVGGRLAGGTEVMIVWPSEVETGLRSYGPPLPLRGARLSSEAPPP